MYLAPLEWITGRFTVLFPQLDNKNCCCLVPDRSSTIPKWRGTWSIIPLAQLFGIYPLVLHMVRNIIIATRTTNSQIQSFFEMIFSRKIFMGITPINSLDRNPMDSSGGFTALDLLWHTFTAIQRQLTAKNRRSGKIGDIVFSGFDSLDGYGFYHQVILFRWDRFPCRAFPN